MEFTVCRINQEGPFFLRTNEERWDILVEQGRTTNPDHNNDAMQLVTSLVDFTAKPIEFIMLKGEQKPYWPLT